MTKMRTRMMNKMTSAEVETYLERNDILFIPIGTVETHGTFPLDCELIFPTAFGLKMAEIVDGLVLGDLPYFFCGATTCSRATVQMSVAKGVEYLKEISHSLLNQGFRRQVYLSAHGPAFLTAGTVVIDFFDETKCPISYIDLADAITVAGQQDPNFDLLKNFNRMMFGAYEICNCKDELVIDPGIDFGPDANPFGDLPEPTELDKLRGFSESRKVDFFHYLRRLAHGSGSVGFYFSEPNDHGRTYGALPSVEVRDKICAEGAVIVERIVELLHMEEYVKEMRDLDKWTNTEIKAKYGRHLPKNKFGSWGG